MICASYTREHIMFGDGISVSEQNEKIAEFLKSRRLKVDKKYSDRKTDGKDDEAFMEMKEAGISRQFDCIVFWSMMYFGKDPLIGYNLLLHTFIPSGIDFAVVSDNFTSIGQSSEEIAAYLQKKYKERRMAHFNNIKVLASESRINTLYGYEKHGDEFLIDSTTETVVKQIFSLALQRKNIKEITLELNQQQIESAHHYLKRIGGKDVSMVSTLWDMASVKKILTDERYKGVRMITKNGIQSATEMPAYISADEYEQIQMGFRSHKRQNGKWDNPLQKRLFDKDTHIRLYAGDYIGNGNRDYFLSKQSEETLAYKKRAIGTNEVLREVRALLEKERSLAQSAGRVITTDIGFLEHEQIRTRLLENGQATLSKMLDMVDKATSMANCDELQKMNDDFSNTQQEINDIDKAFSANNPWIKLYAFVDIPEVLTTEFCRQYIDEVLVERFERVELIPKYAEWKRRLPEYWMEI